MYATDDTAAAAPRVHVTKTLFDRIFYYSYVIILLLLLKRQVIVGKYLIE